MRFKFMRWLAPALAVVCISLGFAAPAHATWSYEPVRWKRWVPATTSTYTYGGHIFVNDTLWVSGAAANLDTTAAWNMLDAEAPATEELGFYGGLSTTDSVGVAVFVITADSTVASSINFKNTTVALQVNYGINNGGWQTFTAAALSPLNTDGTKTLFIPVWRDATPASITTDIGIDLNVPLSCFAPAMRAIVTWGTAAVCPMARCYIRKWAGHVAVTRSGKDFKLE